MRNEILKALKANALGNIEKAKLNVEIYLKNPVGIGEHPDVLASIQDQLDIIAHEEERIEVILKHFSAQLLDPPCSILERGSDELHTAS